MSAVPFTIINGDTYALCNLDFETNLRKIDYAQVSFKFLILYIYQNSKNMELLPKSLTSNILNLS